MVETIDVALTLNQHTLRLRVRSDRRLIDLLRQDLRLTGVKEGCGTGDCGSCTVILNGEAVASCLTMAYQADGGILETIEGLQRPSGLHPLQEALIERGAVQCGFCASGFVLAAKALLDRGGKARPEDIREALVGNLCRCTGYARFLSAVQRAAPLHPPPPTVSAPPAAAPSYYRPRSLEEAIEILAQRQGEVEPIAGGTDVLLRAGGQRGSYFDLSCVTELRGIEDRGEYVFIGAASTHREMAASPVLLKAAPALPRACETIGTPTIRNRATLGGNLATAAPSADTLPALLAADAVVELVSISARRDVPLGEFVTGPYQSVLARDELILGVRIPKRPGVKGAFSRLSQRRVGGASKISVAVAMTFRDGRPDWVRVAIGGAHPVPVRAIETEKALEAGGYESLRRAAEAIGQDFEPSDDLRSTAEYRRLMARVLLERAIRALVES